MIISFLGNETNYTKEIENGNYSFFSAVTFFGFNDGIRFIKIFYIFISFILNLMIFVILCKRKNKNYSIALQLTGNLLMINFIHTFAYLLNWVIHLDKSYKIKIKEKEYYVGGLLIGNPKNNFGMCKTQGFLLIFSSMSQDMLINIYFYIINKSSIITKRNLTLLCYSLGYIVPFLFSLIYLIFGGIGLNDRYCYIKKFEFENIGYSFNNWFRALIIILYTIRGINFIINIISFIKIIKYVYSHNLTYMYILKSSVLLIIQIITIFIGIIYRMSNLFNVDNLTFSNLFLLINTIDGILFPLSFCLSNRIFCNLFNPKYLESSLNSLSDETDDFMNLNKSTLSGPINSNDNENTLAMIDLTNENNFDLSFI
jgi:hypothetical protein